MHPSGLARYRIDDLIREAESERMVRRVRAVQSARRRATFRRAGSGIISLLLWPVRH